jgi:hypothetical protein
MTTPEKAGPFFYALAPLAVILAATLLLQGWRGSRAAAILRTPPRKMTVAPSPRALELTNDFQVIRDRALFYATRKFYAPVPGTPPTTSAQLSSYQLIGTLLVPHKPGVAFLRRGPAGKTATVSSGDDLDGWTVKAVQSGKAVFGYKDQQVTLTTPLPFGNTPAAQSGGIVRMRISQPAQRPASPAHAPQESIQPTRHSRYFPRSHARGG